MFHTVLRYCRDNNLIESDDCILAGVSGGADSVCLLLLLEELQKEIGFSLKAVHVEHGIRGEESLLDALFVEKLCAKYDVPLQSYTVDVPSYASEHGLGTEEAARKLRYDCFEEAANVFWGEGPETASGNATVKIALAHHSDDNAETVLFQMIRGSRTDGLGGMQPMRPLTEKSCIIRPLLGVTRAQIEVYLEQKGQDYRTDATNADVTYSRNRLRKEVLPILTEINAQAIMHMNQSAEYLREVSAYLKLQTQQAAKAVWIRTEEGLLMQKDAFEKLPSLIQRELLHLSLATVAGEAKDLTAKHVDVLAELFDLQVGRYLSMPYRVCAKRVYDGIILSKDTPAESEVCGKEEIEDGIFFSIEKEELTSCLVNGPYEIILPDAVCRMELIERTEEKIEISKNTYTKCLDYDKIIGSFQIRTRRSGDYLMIDEYQHKKRLKEYFINEKIPREKRDKLWLLTEEDKVLWIVGGRISADMKIDERTTRILKVQITGGNYHEN